MATKVYMEALSPTMEEGRPITWLKNEGDQMSPTFAGMDVHADLVCPRNQLFILSRDHLTN